MQAELKQPRIAVLVPCYNEAQTIGQVIDDFRRALPTAALYVFDNNSKDGTSEVARRHGAQVVHVGLQGKGNVVRRMFADVEADVYVMVDGDATYEAAAAPALVQALVQQQQAMLDVAAAAFKAPVGEVPGKIAQVLENVRALEKELARLKSKLAASQGDDLLAQAVEIKGAKVLAATLEGADVTALRETMDKLKDKLKSAAIVLSSVADGKVTLIAGVTADLTGKVKAGELVNLVAQQVGGKGGGRPDMAQAGGTQPENLPAALASVQDWVSGKL